MTPAETFPPREYIHDELVLRNWSRRYLAGRAGVHERVIDEILDNGRPLTPDIADGIGAAFGTSGDMWMKLQRSFDEAGQQ